MAFLDDNVFSQVGQITQRISSAQMMYISFANPLSYQPFAAFFLNGVTQSVTPSSDKFQYWFNYPSVTQTYIQVQIILLGGYEISWFSYSIIYGLPQYLQTDQQQILTFGVVPFTLFTQDTRTKVSQVSITAVMGYNNIRIAVFSSQGSITAYTYSNTVLDQIVLVYFKYLPCPIYCTTCYTSVPNCDGCVSTSYRVGSNCTSCQAHMFLIEGEMNCRQCGPYCDSCSGSATNCVACLPVTLRINPTSCMTCPSQMYVQQGVDNCQQCLNYCHECSSSPDNCTVCLGSSLRTHPPNCTTCPAQYFVVQNMRDCQLCPTLCNNCQNYTGYCITCNTTSSRINPPNCIDCPQYTYLNGNTCTYCDSTCLTCNSQKCLTCLSNQYIDNFGKCMNCPLHCLTCDINRCYSCAGNCAVCNFTSCLKCIQNSYYISGIECNICPQNCSTCDAQQCFTCISPRMSPDNHCECQYPCSTCDLNRCLTCISPDYRILGEVCQPCPSECAACDIEGKCFKEPQNCLLANIVSDSLVQCIQCKTNFYLTDNDCLQCSNQCLECVDQPQNCTSCRFSSGTSNDCYLCEVQKGLYSNYQNNTCYTICGDGIVTSDEECDDGNINSADGCTDCKIDTGYQCIQNICQPIVYPIATIYQNINTDTIYRENKQFSITYNVPIRSQTFNVRILMTNYTQFTYDLTLVNSQLFVLNIDLQQQLINSQIQIIFVNVSEIVSIDGFYQQDNMIECEMTDYIKSTPTEQDISDATNSIINYLFIILAFLIGLSILFGGLDIFWNLLDLLQTISYLKYINTVKPYYLYTFFNLFGFLQFQNLPLNQLINIQSYVQDMIDTQQFVAPPALINEDGYTTSTIINIIPILNIMLTSMSLYFLVQIIFPLIERNTFVLNPKITNLKLSQYFYNFKYYILESSDGIIKQFLFSGIIRVFISSAYEISFMTCLGIYGLQLKNSSNLLNWDLSLTLFAAFDYICLIFIISIICSFQSNTLKVHQNQYGTICEGLHFKGQYTKSYNSLLVIKRLFFMIFLVLLYNEPIFQILNIIMIEVSQLLYLLIIDPLKNHHEKFKQILCESFMLISEIQLAILVLDDYYALFVYDGRRICSWICIMSLVIIIVSQLCLDAHQQIIRYYNRYLFINRIKLILHSI